MGAAAVGGAGAAKWFVTLIVRENAIKRERSTITEDFPITDKIFMIDISKNNENKSIHLINKRNKIKLMFLFPSNS